ncbi:hypothetical protein HRbin15_01197 [bacterium HR15]|nr:hypothetical protein HRbin15_01197 [bacterium HR15]
MHGRLYNELVLEIAISPRTPLIIKSGEKAGIDPARPDMEFVRTTRRNAHGEPEDTLYIPGSSLRGVLRAHAERLLRSLRDDLACQITDQSCIKRKDLKESEISGARAYREACYACRLFGNTAIASRLQIGDLYPHRELEPLTETRYGVAIDRVTGAVAVGPFQMETVTSALFLGRLVLRNFTVGQLGLLGAALLDIADGLVALGHAKSRGLGRVRLNFNWARFRFMQLPPDGNNGIVGIGALASEEIRRRYNLPSPDHHALDGFPQAQHEGLYHTVISREDADIRRWFETLAPLWVEEIEQGGISP